MTRMFDASCFLGLDLDMATLWAGWLRSLFNQLAVHVVGMSTWGV